MPDDDEFDSELRLPAHFLPRRATGTRLSSSATETAQTPDNTALNTEARVPPRLLVRRYTGDPRSKKGHRSD